MTWCSSRSHWRRSPRTRHPVPRPEGLVLAARARCTAMQYFQRWKIHNRARRTCSKAGAGMR
jgi:hypothetical protein